jgi:cell fate regulator YaaT (PSP1 superfamily)
MIKYLVSVYSWENPWVCESELELGKGDYVMVQEQPLYEIGCVVGSVKGDVQEDTREIIRRASEKEIELFQKNEEKKKEILSTCKIEAKRLELVMKLIDARISFDGGSMVVIFTAEERVDFRELVKNLSRIFHRSVRMHQIGSRDEARKCGGCGVCGRDLCCMRLAGNLPSISIDMARVQQVAHRGSERISGFCGRLMCCLSYEACQYKDMLKGMPEVHASVKTPDGAGEVIEINAVTGIVKVRFADGKISQFIKEDIK